MNRLTKKIFNNNNYAVNNIPSESDGVYYCDINVLNKLGKLEDLEEQLGCPLEVLTRKTAMVIKDEQVYEANIYYINFNAGIIAFGSLWSFTERKTKDYQKTWWLKGEKPNE